MRTLKFSVVESWENPLDSYPTALELEDWVRTSLEVEGKSNGGLSESRSPNYGI